MLGCVQTDATTLNIVAPTMLGVVACVLAVVCKWMQQLQQCWDMQCIVGRIQPISLCKPCIMSVRGPNNVGRAVQMDPTLLRYASAITEQKKCWELLAEKFDRFQTLRNNTQQHPTTCNRVWKRTQHVTSNNVGSCWPTMLRPFAWGFKLHNVLALKSLLFQNLVLPREIPSCGKITKSSYVACSFVDFFPNVLILGTVSGFVEGCNFLFFFCSFYTDVDHSHCGHCCYYCCHCQ